MYPNLKEVVGVELCQSRFELAENAAVQLATRFPDEYTVVDWVQGRCISVATTKVRWSSRAVHQAGLTSRPLLCRRALHRGAST